jgi:hypothetical protein
MVTGLLDACSPLKVIFKSAKLWNNDESDNQRTSSSRKTQLGCRMLLLSPNDAISETILDRRTLLSERSERYY